MAVLKSLFFNLAQVVVASFFKPLIRLFRDTNRAYLFCMAASAGLSIAMYTMFHAAGPSGSAASMQYRPLFTLFILNGVLTGAYVSFVQVLIPATVDYGEWKSGNGQAGMVSALNGFCTTAGAALGAQMLGLPLESSGYIAGAMQNGSTLHTLLILAL